MSVYKAICKNDFIETNLKQIKVKMKTINQYDNIKKIRRDRYTYANK